MLQLSAGLGMESRFWDHSHPPTVRDKAWGAIPGHPAQDNGRAASAPRPLHPNRRTKCCLQEVRRVGDRPVAQTSDPHRALAPSLIGSARPDPPPAHLRSDIAKELHSLLPQSRNNSTFPRERRFSPTPASPKAQLAPLFRPSLDDRFCICPVFLFEPPLPPTCLRGTAGHSPIPSPRRLTPRTPVLRAQQVVGEKACRVRNLAEEHQLRHLSPRPPTMRRSPRPASSPSSTNQLTLKKGKGRPGSPTDQ